MARIVERPAVKRARKRKAAAKAVVTRPAPERQAYDVVEFCAAYRVSRTTLYELWKRGEGPRQLRAGSKVLITVDAARQWANGGAAT